jgi:hypothetical protein
MSSHLANNFPTIRYIGSSTAATDACTFSVVQLGRWVQAAVVAAGVVLAAASGPLIRRLSARPRPRPADSSAFRGPVRAGATLGRWTVQRVDDASDGAIVVALSGPDGKGFTVDVLRRDDGGPPPVATTSALALYLFNQPDVARAGKTSSDEEQAQAVQALAAALRAREDGGATPPKLPSLREHESAQKR